MDIGQLVDQISRAVSQASQDVQSKTSAGDLSDPEKMLKTQFSMQQYSVFVGYASSVIKMIKDMLSGIIAKI